jgi:hypothetical protein
MIEASDNIILKIKINSYSSLMFQNDPFFSSDFQEYSQHLATSDNHNYDIISPRCSFHLSPKLVTNYDGYPAIFDDLEMERSQMFDDHYDLSPTKMIMTETADQS